MGLESRGYKITIFGPEGREKYTLRYKGQVVGRGDLRQAVAKSAGRQRLEQFERKSYAFSNAEARLRKFALDSQLSENP
jgi:hypothetical protein